MAASHYCSVKVRKYCSMAVLGGEVLLDGGESLCSKVRGTARWRSLLLDGLPLPEME